jgi:chemotaxis protein CheC
MIAISDYQIDVLKELMNIGVGRSISALHDLVHSHIVMDVPKVEVLSVDEASARLLALGLTTGATVNLQFEGPFSGVSSLYFPTAEADKLVSLLDGRAAESSESLELLRSGILMEIGNIVLNGVMGIFGNTLGRHFSFSVPDYFECSSNEILKSRSTKTSIVLLSLCNFHVEDSHIDGYINLIFDIESLNSLLAAVDSASAGL